MTEEGASIEAWIRRRKEKSHWHTYDTTYPNQNRFSLVHYITRKIQQANNENTCGVWKHWTLIRVGSHIYRWFALNSNRNADLLLDNKWQSHVLLPFEWGVPIRLQPDEHILFSSCERHWEQPLAQQQNSKPTLELHPQIFIFIEANINRKQRKECIEIYTYIYVI